MLTSLYACTLLLLSIHYKATCHPRFPFFLHSVAFFKFVLHNLFCGCVIPQTYTHMKWLCMYMYSHFIDLLCSPSLSRPLFACLSVCLPVFLSIALSFLPSFLTHSLPLPLCSYPLFLLTPITLLYMYVRGFAVKPCFTPLHFCLPSGNELSVLCLSQHIAS